MDPIDPRRYITKHKRGESLTSKEQKILLTVLGNVMIDNPELSPTQACKKTAHLTGTGYVTVLKIKSDFDAGKQAVTPGKKRPRLEHLSQKRTVVYGHDVVNGVRRLVHSFFRRNEAPTLQKIKAELDKDISLPTMSTTTIRRFLCDIGFVYCKRKRNSAFLERSDLIDWRRRYLRQMQKLRAQNAKIFYLDETWINAGHTTSYAWHDTTVVSPRDAHREGLTVGLKQTPGKGGRLIVLHLGNEDGFIPGCKLVFEAGKSVTLEDGTHHDEMTGQRFEEWWVAAMDHLPPGSHIVMDNA
ncbi:hypothetical protein FOCC_FOCC017855, partial [Frankliniella occidentalis]|uniref:Uncharacterized protein LOC113216530 n=1 Tax=Frankliniella occidentalis TaxID=133901 RepID=A0A9C6XVS1_FRAOC